MHNHNPSYGVCSSVVDDGNNVDDEVSEDAGNNED